VSRSLLGPATLLALGVGAGCVAVAGLVVGGRGALSAVAGTAVVLGFLWLGQLPVAQAAQGRRQLAKALLILGLTLRMAVVFVALRVLMDFPVLDRRVLGVSIVLTALAWTAGATWTFARLRSVTIEPDRSERPQV